MSVWTNPCYTLDPLWKTVRMLPKGHAEEHWEELRWLMQDKIGNLGAGNSEFEGRTIYDYLKAKPRERSEIIRKAQTSRYIPPKEQVKFANTIAEAKIQHSGIQAVYWAISNIWNENWYFKDSEAFEKVVNFSETLQLLDVPISRIPMKKAKEDAAKLTKILLKDEKYKKLYIAREMVDEFWTYRFNRSYFRWQKKKEGDDAKCPYRKVNGTFSKLVVHTFQLGYIIEDLKSKQRGIFFWKDHDRLVNTINAIANLQMYMSTYDIDDYEVTKSMVKGFEGIMDVIAESMRYNTRESNNKLCRALDVSFNLYIAELAQDVDSRSLKDQLEKVKRESLNEAINVNSILSIAKRYGRGVTETLELLRVYKILPCPDFCPFSVIPNLNDKFVEKNEFIGNSTVDLVGVGVNNGVIEIKLEEFKRYIRRSKIITFFNRHKRFPGRLKDPMNCPVELSGYPDVRESDITLDNVDCIDLEGSFQYRRFDGCEYELVKDKKTAQAWETKVNSRVSTNQLLQFLFDSKFMGQGRVRKCFETGTYVWDKTIDVALKPEAKKPTSRAFFMAPDPARRMLSEFEINVSRYVEHKNGSSQGKNDMNMDKKFADITQWEEVGFRKLLISFDLKAFSSGQDIKFKEIGLQSWAEVFGEPSILNIRDIFQGYNLKWDKFHLNNTLKLSGNDLEGFNGRMNTDLHLDVMGYAIHKLRRAGLLRTGGKMECLIDDGLLALMVEDEKFETDVPMILKVIETVYKTFGLAISWDKTYVSSFLCQYLNRIFIDGEEVTGGAKAFLRIGKLDNTPIPTLSDHLEAHAATARGAIKSGTDHRVAYRKYTLEVTKSLFKWSNYDEKLSFTNDLAVRCFAPVGLGGFGISSSFMLSSNMTFDPLNSGIGNLTMIARSIPRFYEVCNALVNNGVRDQSCEGILRAPRSLRTNYRCLNVRRFANRAREVVISKSVNQFVKEVAELLSATSYSPIADIVCQMQAIHDVVRSKLWQMDPNYSLDKIVGKLQNSSTAASLIGKRASIAIALINKSEAKQLILESDKGKFVTRA